MDKMLIARFTLYLWTQLKKKLQSENTLHLSMIINFWAQSCSNESFFTNVIFDNFCSKTSKYLLTDFYETRHNKTFDIFTKLINLSFEMSFILVIFLIFTKKLVFINLNPFSTKNPLQVVNSFLYPGNYIQISKLSMKLLTSS